MYSHVCVTECIIIGGYFMWLEVQNTSNGYETREVYSLNSFRPVQTMIGVTKAPGMVWLLACVITTTLLLLFYISDHLSHTYRLKLQRNPSFGVIAKERQTNSSSVTQMTVTRIPVVLIYTAFFGAIPWKGMEDSQKFTQANGKPCRNRNCVVSYNKEEFASSDVVIFHGRDLPSVTTLRELHSRRSSKQAWGFFILESPAHSPDTSQFSGMFNWTLTYRRDSDVYVPYGFYKTLESEGEKAIPATSAKDYSYGKDKLIVWTVSNCGGKRFSYVDKLKQFVKVDILGACSGKSCPHNSGDCVKLLRSYKFQLAFENTECLDYVTEKYWGSPLVHGIVPIVMGGADYKEIAIPGSYIDVRDFPSIQELADYLLYLDKNNTAYNEYFHWKTKYKLGDCLRNGDMTCLRHWTCDLCALANNASAKSKVYEHLEDFWSGRQCDRLTEQFDQIINQ